MASFLIKQHTPVHGLYLVLQISSTKVNGAKLQYHSQPVDRWAAVF